MDDSDEDYMTYGRRTQRFVLEGKHIRKHKDGIENFNDYFSGTDEDSSSDGSRHANDKGQQKQSRGFTTRNVSAQHDENATNSSSNLRDKNTALKLKKDFNSLITPKRKSHFTTKQLEDKHTALKVDKGSNVKINHKQNELLDSENESYQDDSENVEAAYKANKISRVEAHFRADKIVATKNSSFQHNQGDSLSSTASEDENTALKVNKHSSVNIHPKQNRQLATKNALSEHRQNDSEYDDACLKVDNASNLKVQHRQNRKLAPRNNSYQHLDDVGPPSDSGIENAPLRTDKGSKVKTHHQRGRQINTGKSSVEQYLDDAEDAALRVDNISNGKAHLKQNRTLVTRNASLEDNLQETSPSSESEGEIVLLKENNSSIVKIHSKTNRQLAARTSSQHNPDDSSSCSDNENGASELASNGKTHKQSRQLAARNALSEHYQDCNAFKADMVSNARVEIEPNRNKPNKILASKNSSLQRNQDDSVSSSDSGDKNAALKIKKHLSVKNHHLQSRQLTEKNASSEHHHYHSEDDTALKVDKASNAKVQHRQNRKSVARNASYQHCQNDSGPSSESESENELVRADKGSNVKTHHKEERQLVTKKFAAEHYQYDSEDDDPALNRDTISYDEAHTEQDGILNASHEHNLNVMRILSDVSPFSDSEDEVEPLDVNKSPNFKTHHKQNGQLTTRNASHEHYQDDTNDKNTDLKEDKASNIKVHRKQNRILNARNASYQHQQDVEPYSQLEGKDTTLKVGKASNVKIRQEHHQADTDSFSNVQDEDTVLKVDKSLSAKVRHSQSEILTSKNASYRQHQDIPGPSDLETKGEKNKGKRSRLMNSTRIPLKSKDLQELQSFDNLLVSPIMPHTPGKSKSVHNHKKTQNKSQTEVLDKGYIASEDKLSKSSSAAANKVNNGTHSYVDHQHDGNDADLCKSTVNRLKNSSRTRQEATYAETMDESDGEVTHISTKSVTRKHEISYKNEEKKHETGKDKNKKVPSRKDIHMKDDVPTALLLNKSPIKGGSKALKSPRKKMLKTNSKAKENMLNSENIVQHRELSKRLSEDNVSEHELQKNKKSKTLDSKAIAPPTKTALKINSKTKERILNDERVELLEGDVNEPELHNKRKTPLKKKPAKATSKYLKSKSQPEFSHQNSERTAVFSVENALNNESVIQHGELSKRLSTNDVSESELNPRSRKIKSKTLTSPSKTVSKISSKQKHVSKTLKNGSKAPISPKTKLNISAQNMPIKGTHFAQHNIQNRENDQSTLKMTSLKKKPPKAIAKSLKSQRQPECSHQNSEATADFTVETYSDDVDDDAPVASPAKKRRTENPNDDRVKNCCVLLDNISRESMQKDRSPANKSTVKSFTPRNKVGKEKVQTKKQRKNHETTTTNVNNLRRSKRTRISPLKPWCNERVRYRYNMNGEITFVDIVRQPEREPEREPERKKQKNKTKSSKQVAQPKAFKVFDASSGKTVSARVFRPEGSTEWLYPDDYDHETAPYHITRVFKSENISFGFLKLRSSKRKPSQQLPHSDACFMVFRGQVKVKIHKSVFCAQPFDSFIVPCGNAYSIENISNANAMLTFCIYTGSILTDLII